MSNDDIHASIRNFDTWDIPVHDSYYMVSKSFMIALNKKPNIIHRLFVRILLGWKWVGINKS